MQQVSKYFSGNFLLFLLSIVFLYSCEEAPNELGLNLQKSNSEFRVGFTDTISVESYTLTQDSVRSDKAIYSPSGTFIDPVFGTTEASLVTQLRLSTPLDPGNGVHIDSLVLFLLTADHYGDDNSEMKLKVYESFKHLYLDSIYYSNMDISDSIGINPVGEETIFATDSIIKIYLDPLLGEKLLSDSAALQSQAGFLSFFQGLYFAPPEILSGNGAIINFNLLSFDSKLTVYYGNNVEDSLSYDFIINSSSARVNLFRHDYTTADPGQKINHLDDGIQDSVIYVQGNSGVMSRIDIPYFDVWKDSLPLVVNKMEMILSVSPNDSLNQKIDSLPYQLNLLLKNSDGNFQIVSDFIYGVDYFGGILDNNEYHFTLTNQFQNYLMNGDPTEKNQFYLIVENGNYLSNRAVLTSSLNSLKLHFRFTYTKLKP